MDGAQFGSVPSAASKAKSYETWSKDFSGWLFRTQKVDLLKSPSAKEASRPGESERDFRVRLQQSGREARDKQSDSLRRKYASKMAALQDRIRRAGQMVERQQAESRSSQMQAAISVGASILGAFLGRKTISAANIGRATTAIRGAGRAIKESGDVGQAEENVSALQQQLADLESQFKKESDALAAATDPTQRETRNRLSQTHQSQHQRETRDPSLDAALAGCRGQADVCLAITHAFRGSGIQETSDAHAFRLHSSSHRCEWIKPPPPFPVPQRLFMCWLVILVAIQPNDGRGHSGSVRRCCKL